MKVKYNAKIINLDLYDKIEVIPKDQNRLFQTFCDEDTATAFFLVATRTRPAAGILGGVTTETEDLVGLKTREFAEKLLSVLLDHWESDTKTFDINRYFQGDSPITPKSVRIKRRRGKDFRPKATESPQ